MKTWGLVCVAVAISAMFIVAGGFTLRIDGLAVVTIAALTCEGLALFYRTRRPDPRMAATLSAVAQLVVLSAAAGALSYAVAAWRGPLWDQTFASWDRALGLDWLAYASLLDRSPAVAWVAGLAYDSFEAQILVVLLALGFTGRTRALNDFCVAFALAAMAVVLISGSMPALGAYTGLGLSSGRFPHIPPRDVDGIATVVTALRQGGLKSFSLQDIYGIISFPSFHTAGGILVVGAMWRIPSLRWPFVVLDGVMIAATPAYGAHYFVDLLGGAATALAAMAVASMLRQPSAAPSAHDVVRPEVGLPA